MKCIVFSEFSRMCKILNRELKGSLMIIGETPQEERQKIIKDFQENPERQILIMSRAGEMALNLHQSDLVFHYDCPMTYASYDQRISRARRQGRKDPVVSVRMVTRGTLEEKIYKLIEKKKDISLATMPFTELIKELL